METFIRKMAHMKSIWGMKQFIRAMIYKANAEETKKIYECVEKVMKGKYWIKKNERRGN